MNCRNTTTPRGQRTRWWGKALALAALLMAGGASAQINAYSFAQTSGTYTEITGGTVIATATTLSGATSLDDVNYAVNFAPFSFTFNGTAYTSLNLNSNGYITFGATLPAAGFPYTPISNTAAYAGAVAAWGGDINGFFNLGGLTSQLRWEVVGTSPNQELVLQWKDFRPAFSTSATAAYRINFQIRLKENGNVVEVVYGPSGIALGAPTSSGTRQIGLRGATNAAFNNRTNTTLVAFTASTAGGTNAATQAYNIVGATPGMPSNGLTYTWTAPVPCTGTPNAGSVTTPVTVCSGSNAVLTATGLTTGLNITYQWEESPDGSTGWLPVVGGSGATTATYTTTAINATRYFRLVTTCSTGPNSNNTNVVTVNPANPTYLVFNGVGHSESFESWSNLCNTTDVPTTNWKNTPETGNNSWRRHDQQASAGWGNPTFGAYTPVSTAGASSARFHSYQASSGQQGSLDLYIDMTAGSGSNGLTFDYINTSGTDVLAIFQSTDGGVNFTQLGANVGVAATWTSVSRTITSTSATTVIRLRATSDFGTTDIGVDNLQITSPCLGTPAPGATTGPALACSGAPFNLGLTNATSGNGVSYQWYVSTVSNTGPWTPVGPNAPVYAATQTAQSWYYCDVTCATGPSTGSSGVIEVNMDVPTNCYCTPTYTFGKTDGDLLSNVVIVGTTLANNSGTAPTNPAYTFFNTLPNHTANLQAGTSYTIQATVGTFASQNIAVWIDFNEDGVFTTPAERVGFTTTSIGANGTGSFTLSLPCDPEPGVKRMRVRDVWNTAGNTIDPCINYGYGETEDYNVTILAPPACPQPNGLAFNTVTFNSANITWSVGCTETAWEIEYGPTGFTLGTGTTVPATSPYALGGLTGNTGYDVYVRADCGVNGLSASAGPVNFTTPPAPPANDLCANAIAISCNSIVTGTTVAATNTGAPASCGGYVNNATSGVWYTITGWNGPMEASLCTGTGYDSQIAVFTGSCGAFTCVAGSDDFCSSQSEVTWTGTTGTTYYIYVAGWNAAAGSFTLTTTCGSNNPVCPANGLTVEFQTDAAPFETTWEIRNGAGTVVASSGGPLVAPNGIQTESACIPDGCYTLRVLDAGGDGMTTGGYILRTQGTNQRIIDNRENFNSGSVSAISGGQGFCLPMSAQTVLFTSCDKLDWVTGQYMVAAPNPAVSAEWIPNGANSVQDNNSGYEFWIFDPNGSYSFRRFRSHNVSDGFGPASATRACHMKINNWAPASQIPATTLMNVRVRTRINGVNGEFGPACRMEINPALAACPQTQLFNIPGDPDFSCGATRQWGTGNFVFARPVSGANRYQFRFRIAAEGFEVVRTATTYFVQLNWAVLPLQNGKTYDVDVRVSKDGGLTWCSSSDPWGPVCQLTIGTPSFNAMAATSETGSAKELRMFPNPNRGDVLNVSLTGIEEGVNTVSVDIYDLTGKRMSARTLAVAGNSVITTMDLGGELAAGMYLVNITAGSTSYTERLVIQP